MNPILRREAAADVERLTKGAFCIESDAGGVYLVEAATGERVNLLRQASIAVLHAKQLSRLSRRERDVLELLGDAVEMKDIAERLGVSIKTAETYRARLKSKLDLKRGSELFAFAVRWRFEMQAADAHEG